MEKTEESEVVTQASIRMEQRGKYLTESKELFAKQFTKNVDALVAYENNEHVDTIDGIGRLDGVVSGHGDRLLVLEGVIHTLLVQIEGLKGR